MKEIKKPGVNFIPVHINKCRDETHYWDWSSDLGEWVKGKEIPDNLKRMYKLPPAKTTYNKRRAQ
jgi:hypothetical protein